MDINAINNIFLGSSTNANGKNTKQDSTFDNILGKVSSDSKEPKNSNVVENKPADNEASKEIQSSQDIKEQNSNVKDEDSKPVTKEVKDSLKDAGVPEDDLEKIKNLKDLKNYIAEKILKSQSKGAVDINGLLAILAAFINGNFTKENVSDIKSKITEELGTNLKDLVSKTLNVKPNDELLDKVRQQILSNVLTKDNLQGDSILASIQKELAAVLKENSKAGEGDTKTLLSYLNNSTIQKEVSLKENSKTNENNSTDLLSDLKASSKNLNVQESEQAVQSKESKNSSSSDFMSGGKKSNTDEDFLKNLLSNKDDKTSTATNKNDKISRVTNFMSQFNNAIVNNNNVSKLENVVINKNNFSADIIKTISYMETNNLKDLTVKIAPKELGEVVIKLTMDAGVMKAAITASNKEAYNLLNSNLTDITNKLQNNDVKIQNLSLNIYNEDTTFFKDGSQDQKNNNQQNSRKAQNIDGISEEKEALDSFSTIDSNVDMLA